jgi:ankyrin repeat protein
MMVSTAEEAACLCDFGANMCAVGNDGRHTALHNAVIKEQLDVVKVLLERGAGTLEHILKENSTGATPLSMAIGAEDEKIAILLLRSLVQCAGFDISHPLAGWYNEQPLLAAAASQGMCEVLQLALDNGALVNATGKYGSAAAQASYRGHMQALDLLHQRGADLMIGKCLLKAAAQGHVHIIKTLLELGVDVNSLSAGQTHPSLFYATALAHLAAVEALLAAGAVIPLDQQNSLLRSLCQKLDDAVAAQVLKLVLPQCGKYEAVPRSDEEPTAFAQAVNNGKLQPAKLLASAGADVTYVDMHGHNAVHRAASNSSLEMVQWFVSIGVDPRARGSDGGLPLHMACAQAFGRADIVQYLLSLPGAAADVKAVDVDGRTPLHVAASSSNEAALKALLQRGADVTARTARGSTALMLASTTPVVKLLLAAGADATAVDSSGTSVLHYCAENSATLEQYACY